MNSNPIVERLREAEEEFRRQEKFRYPFHIVCVYEDEDSNDFPIILEVRDYCGKNNLTFMARQYNYDKYQDDLGIKRLKKNTTTLSRRMLWSILAAFLATANAAQFISYFDARCTLPITKVVAFTDVCTWSSNRYSGSYALYLSGCSATQLNITAFNLTGSAGCQGEPVATVVANSSCVAHEDAYVKAVDFSCESQNTTYNVLAHFTPDCQDGGYAFSIELGQPTCLEDSFAPGLWDWDAQGNYSEPYYQLDLYNSTDGTCQDNLATFQTKTFPAWCLPTVQPFQNISIDIYPAIPLN